MSHGRVYDEPGGKRMYFMGRWDVDRAKRRGVDSRLGESIAVVVGQDEVILVIPTPDASRLQRFRHNRVSAAPDPTAARPFACNPVPW